jgi:hypothetical protein
MDIVSFHEMTTKRYGNINPMLDKLKENDMRCSPRGHLHLLPWAQGLVMLLFVLALLAEVPSSALPGPGFFPADGRIIVQVQDTLVIDRDEQTGDRVIQVVPPSKSAGEAGVEIRQEQDAGDRVFHVRPRHGREQNTDVLIGPVIISPEITLPDHPRPID